MFVMHPPVCADHAVPLRRIVLESTGREVHPDPESGVVRAIAESEAAELEADGWTRRADKVLDADTLRKIMSIETVRTGIGAVVAPHDVSAAALVSDSHAAELRHFGKGTEPSRRVVVGEVDVGRPIGRVHVEHDQLGDEIIVHGVTANLTDSVDHDLANAFRRATSSFLDAAQDAEAQSDAKTIIASLVAAMLQRHRHLADAVAAQKMRQRRA